MLHQAETTGLAHRLRWNSIGWVQLKRFDETLNRGVPKSVDM